MVRKNKAKKSNFSPVNFLLFFVVLFLVATNFTFADTLSNSRKIDYFPRNQKLSSVSKPAVGTGGYPYEINESACSLIEDINSKLDKCRSCIDLKNTCPDCCLVNLSTTSRNLSCSGYTLLGKPFSPNPGSLLKREKCTDVFNFVMPNCTSPDLGTGTSDNKYREFKKYCADTVSVACPKLPGAEKLGCPTDEPNYDGTTTKCVKSASGWVCNTDTIDDSTINALKNPGCVPSSTGGVTDCTTLMHTTGGGVNKGFYKVQKLKAADCSADYPTFTNCYEYVMHTDIKDCISTCLTKADAYEQSFKSLYCCMRDSNVCEETPGSIEGLNGVRPGYQNNCSGVSCQSRINWTECADPTAEFCCDNLVQSKCDGLQAQLNALINKIAEGTTTSCFNDISKADDQLKYDFIAKSNEKLLIIWQAGATPRYCLANAGGTACSTSWDTGTEPNTYFYTMVKVFDVTSGEGSKVEVYPGVSGDTIMNQRSFISAFSIYAAAVAENPDGTSIFTQGHKYSVRLYYLIAPLTDYILKANINRSQLTILRIRE